MAQGKLLGLVIDRAAAAELREKAVERNTALAYFIHDEEVPRAGTRVSVGFQRTRWKGSRAMKRETGRDEGSSGLSFDEVLPSVRPRLVR